MLTSHVFQKLEDYSRARHSNVVTIFRDVDKVCCPTTDPQQLHQLSVRPNPSSPSSSQDQSGSLTASEMKTVMKGWGINLHDDEFNCLVKVTNGCQTQPPTSHAAALSMCYPQLSASSPADSCTHMHGCACVHG